jgi:uncharacterized protein
MKAARDSRMGELPPWLATHGDGWMLALHVQPGAKRTAVVGTHGDRLKIAVAAPARDGLANDALLGFLASQLTVRRSALSLVSGATARSKRVAIATAMDAARIIAALVAPE